MSKGSTGFNSDEEEIIFGVNLNSWSDPLNINRNNFQLVQPISKDEESIQDYELVKEEINQTLLEANKLSILERVYASEEDIMLEEEFLKNNFSINTGKISKELINNKLFIYDVIERSPGDPGSVSEEDRASIISQSRSSQLQYLFNTLRTEYGLDNKYSENELIVNQTS